jgi:hypothetical protein
MPKGGVEKCSCIKIELTAQERRLLEFFRNQLQYGEACVIVRKGQPVFVKQVIQEIKLD